MCHISFRGKGGFWCLKQERFSCREQGASAASAKLPAGCKTPRRRQKWQNCNAGITGSLQPGTLMLQIGGESGKHKQRSKTPFKGRCTKVIKTLLISREKHNAQMRPDAYSACAAYVAAMHSTASNPSLQGTMTAVWDKFKFALPCISCTRSA